MIRLLAALVPLICVACGGGGGGGGIGIGGATPPAPPTSPPAGGGGGGTPSQTCTSNGSDGYGAAPKATIQHPYLLSQLITNVTPGAGGLARLTVASTADLTTGSIRVVSGVVGATYVNGSWTINVIDATHVDLQSSIYSSLFSEAYVSGGILGYAKRPNWCVAGVDYAVGYPSATALTAWPTYVTTLQATYGASYVTTSGSNPTAITVYVAAGGVSFNAVDFSTSGGAEIYFHSSPNGSIINSYFYSPHYSSDGTYSVIIADTGSPGLTVKYNILDAGVETQGTTQTGSNPLGAFISSNGGGTVTIEYNWFKNSGGQYVSMSGPSSGSNIAFTYEFNFFDNANVVVGGHQNWLQWSGGVAPSTMLAYNTGFQNAVGGAEGFQLYYNIPGSFSSPTIANNVEIALPSSGTNTMSYINNGSGGIPTNTTGTPVSENNYIDPTGAYGAFYPGSFQAFSSGMYSGPAWTFSNQWNMATGVAFSNTPP